MALRELWRASGRPFALVDDKGKVVEVTPTWVSTAATGGFRSPAPILGQNLSAICPYWARTKVTAEWPKLVTGDRGLQVTYPVDRPGDQARWFILLIEKESSASAAIIRLMVMLVSVLEVFEDSVLLDELKRHAGISRESILVDILRHGVVNFRLDS